MTDSAKEKIAAALQATTKSDNFRLGKPLFVHITTDTTSKSLIGPELHTLFAALNVNTGWLFGQFTCGFLVLIFCKLNNNFVPSVKIVNDAAERGVKQISDFPTITTTDA